MYNPYEKYRLKEVINASGKMTALGVSKYVEDALEAQRFGGQHFFEMEQLDESVGNYLAKLLDVEDVCIVSSASAGIAQVIAGVIGQGSNNHLHHPYSDKIIKREVIIPKGHNVDYGVPVELMVQLGGGTVVEAGYANKCSPHLLEEMITNHTVAILYVKSHHTVQKSMLTIEEAVEVAQQYQLPLIVDAAAEEDLRKYIQLGADVVIYSGSKAIQGPTSGLVLGRRQIITWTRLQSKGIGRAMKIGKENILGLAAAVESYLKVGTESADEMQARLLPFIDKLNELPHIESTMVQDSAGREIYRAQIKVSQTADYHAKELFEKLKQGNPAIYTRNHQANNGILEFDIRSINEKEMDTIVLRMNEMMQ